MNSAKETKKKYNIVRKRGERKREKASEEYQKGESDHLHQMILVGQ